MRNRAPPPDPPLYATEGRESTLYPLKPTFLTRSILSQYCDRMVLCSCNSTESRCRRPDPHGGILKDFQVFKLCFNSSENSSERSGEAPDRLVDAERCSQPRLSPHERRRSLPAALGWSE